MGGLTLMYHRIGDPGADPWRLAISPERFARQLDHLAESHEVVPLDRITSRDRALAITFDDGYADNLRVAAPLLVARGLPATVFVTSGAVSTTAPFWWDQLADLVLGAGPPGPLSLRLDQWHGWSPGDPEAQREAHDVTWHWMQRRGPAARERVLAALRSWRGVRDAPVRAAALTTDELRELAAMPGITIGAHSVDHPLLPALDRVAQHHQLAASRRRLEEITGRVVTTMSYPYGAHDAVTRDAARRVGYTIACTTAGRAVRAGDPVDALPRVQVENWEADEFAERLRGWIAQG